MKRFVLFAILAFPALAARTTVADILTRADGSTCAGSLSISWPSFTNSDGFFFAGNILSPIINGIINVSLEPANVYTVEYVVAPAGCTPTTEFWNIPASMTPVPLSTVRSVNPPPPMPFSIPLSYITQSGAILNQVPQWNGSNWVPVTIATGGIPGGSNGQCQYNNAGSFGGITGCTSNGTSITLTAPALGTPTSLILINATGLPIAGISGLGSGVGVALAAGTSGSGAICLVSGSACAGGTVTVVGAGSLANTALATGGGAQTIQTPSAMATMDSGGNISTPGTVSSGIGSGNAGATDMISGTVQAVPSNSFGWGVGSTMTTSVRLQSPNAVPSANQVMLFGAPSSNIATWTWTGVSGTGSFCMTTSCSMTTPALGTPSAAVLANATGLPIAGLTGLGTGVAAALAASVSGTGAICLASGSACSGGATNLTIGTSTITSGTTTRVLFDNGGVVGEYVVSGSGNVAMTTSPTFTTPALGTPSAIVLTNATALPCGAMPALTGDATSSATSCATTVAKVNGIAYSATAAAHTVQVTTTANATVTAKVVPNCTDTGGNHLNFTQSTDAFSCGTSGGSAAFPLTFVQESQQISATNVSTFTVTFPQAAASSGNTLFMMVATDGSASVGLPSGWTADINQTQATFARFILLHKASASDTTAVFTLSSSNIAVYFFEVTGTHALDQSSAAGVSERANLTLPAITPTAGSVVFGMIGWVTTGASTYTSWPANPAWRALQIQNPFNGGRILSGFVSTQAATNVSTTPPQFSTNGSVPFSGGGMAYATFSIL